MERESPSAVRQLWFSFLESMKTRLPARREARTLPILKQHLQEPPVVDGTAAESEQEQEHEQGNEISTSLERRGRDAVLEKQARDWLDRLGLHEGAMKLKVEWNRKLRSTAGYAKWPMWKVELNPLLADFPGQVDRTLKHELAHLIAYARAGRKRIDPHGKEWRKACADLGIPDESARHTLPLPRSKQTRNFTYQCPSCAVKVERVRKFQRHTACLACCKMHNHGRYDVRFQFLLIGKKD
ncbi:SprT-like domain-containing protein [Roseimicrobium sp. ORNL1]|uniref:SprT family zinc-dependent metalloprotease n=1 Tax=Roseimicrobium sp. ORNL1 TaxID=2711231 RepID=UPI001981C589|nr:SprT-like domain-containing protein [Roseimicrobium sp. ORNL1]